MSDLFKMFNNGLFPDALSEQCCSNHYNTIKHSVGFYSARENTVNFFLYYSGGQKLLPESFKRGCSEVPHDLLLQNSV